MNAEIVSFLLVEDDDDHAYIVERSISESRIVNEVTRVRDGEQAIDFLKRRGEYENAECPDVILLDLNLPKIDGFEVLEQIRQDPALESMLVVVLTTSDTEHDLDRAYRLKANSFLKKPMDFEKFKQMVADLCLYWGVWNQMPPAN